MERKTGIVRRVDDLGRIVLPKEIRDRMGLNNYVSIVEFERGVLIEEYKNMCLYCKKVFEDENFFIRMESSEQSRILCLTCIGILYEKKIAKQGNLT